VKTCQSLDPNLNGDQDEDEYNKMSFTEDPNGGNNETEDHNGVDDNSDGDDGNQDFERDLDYEEQERPQQLLH
jgi:hypothetical protein